MFVGCMISIAVEQSPKSLSPGFSPLAVSPLTKSRDGFFTLPVRAFFNAPLQTFLRLRLTVFAKVLLVVFCAMLLGHCPVKQVHNACFTAFGIEFHHDNSSNGNATSPQQRD